MKRSFFLLLLTLSLAGCNSSHRAAVGTLVYDITICRQYYVTDTDDILGQYTVRDSTGKVWNLPYASAGKSKADCVRWDPVETAQMPDPDVPPPDTN